MPKTRLRLVKAKQSMAKKTTYLPRGQRILNTIFISLVRLGVVPGAHLISVSGRKSGVMHTTPVYVLKHQGSVGLSQVLSRPTG